MLRRQPRSTHTDTLFTYTTVVRAVRHHGVKGVSSPRVPRSQSVDRAQARWRDIQVVRLLHPLLGNMYARHIGFGGVDTIILQAWLAAEKCGQGFFVTDLWLLAAKEIGRATSELQPLMRISYAVVCLKIKKI